MQQWGYPCSVYNEHAKLWILFKQKSLRIEKGVVELNQAMVWEYLHFKDGFMDFWPG